METIAVAAVSARVLAQAAAAAGCRVFALDAYGDLDTRRAAAAWMPVGRNGAPRLDPERCLAGLRRAAWQGATGWIAGAGFEGEPDLLEAGAALLPLLGTPARRQRASRQPDGFFRLLDEHGVAHPPVRFEAPDDACGWLVKDAAACGGWHIRRAGDGPAEEGRRVRRTDPVQRACQTSPAPLADLMHTAHPTHPMHPMRPKHPTHPKHRTYPTYPAHPAHLADPAHPPHLAGRADPTGDAPAPPGSIYWQRLQPGTPMSACFVGDGRRAQVLGINRLLVRPLGHRPLVYAGAIGPVPLSTLPAAALATALGVLVPHYEVRGLASLDFMLDGDRLQVLELNARPSASMALYERAQPGRTVAAHLAACGKGRPGRLEHDHARPPASVEGSEIVYARRPLRLDLAAAARLAAWPGVHDVPAPGAAFAAGDPICSLAVSGRHAAEVEDRLATQRLALLHSLETS